MIHVVDDLLAEILRKEFGKAFAPAEMPDVVFDHPSVLPAGAPPTVALYLYDVRENVALRGDPFAIDRRPDGRVATKVRSSLRFDLTYAVSGHAGDPRTEHALLTFVLGAFLRNPSVAMPTLREADAPTMILSIAQTEQDASPPTPPTPGTRPTPSLPLRVTAPFNPFDVETVPLVREAILGYGQGTQPGFPSHPVDAHAISLSAAGIVTAGDQPVPNVLVSVVDRLTRTTTDENGQYLLLNLPAGSHELLFERRGYAPVRKAVEVPAPGRIHELRTNDVALEPLDHEGAIAEARDRPPLDFSHLLQTDLGQRTSVVGRLRYPDGAPAAFVPVRMGPHSTVTDSQGVYALGVAPYGTPLIAEIPGHGRVEVRDETAPRAGKDDAP